MGAKQLVDLVDLDQTAFAQQLWDAEERSPALVFLQTLDEPERSDTLCREGEKAQDSRNISCSSPMKSTQYVLSRNQSKTTYVEQTR